MPALPTLTSPRLHTRRSFGSFAVFDLIPGPRITPSFPPLATGSMLEVQRITRTITDVALDTLLSHAADAGTDFIVMGGYGHSRLREFVFGGVTRSMLRSMTVPVLMSH